MAGGKRRRDDGMTEEDILEKEIKALARSSFLVLWGRITAGWMDEFLFSRLDEKTKVFWKSLRQIEREPYYHLAKSYADEGRATVFTKMRNLIEDHIEEECEKWTAYVEEVSLNGLDQPSTSESIPFYHVPKTSRLYQELRSPDILQVFHWFTQSIDDKLLIREPDRFDCEGNLRKDQRVRCIFWGEIFILMAVNLCPIFMYAMAKRIVNSYPSQSVSDDGPNWWAMAPYLRDLQTLIEYEVFKEVRNNEWGDETHVGIESSEQAIYYVPPLSVGSSIDEVPVKRAKKALSLIPV